MHPRQSNSSLNDFREIIRWRQNSKLTAYCKCQSNLQKDSRVDRMNYRSVSLTSIVGKVMEEVIRDVFMGFLVKKQAFLREASWIFSRIELCHELTRDILLTNALSEGHNVDEILLEFSKAFDIVPHRRLINKTRGYGEPNKLT